MQKTTNISHNELTSYSFAQFFNCVIAHFVIYYNQCVRSTSVDNLLMKICRVFYAVISDLAEAANLKRQQKNRLLELDYKQISIFSSSVLIPLAQTRNKTFSSFKGIRSVLPPGSSSLTSISNLWSTVIQNQTFTARFSAFYVCFADFQNWAKIDDSVYSKACLYGRDRIMSRNKRFVFPLPSPTHVINDQLKIAIKCNNN